MVSILYLNARFLRYVQLMLPLNMFVSIVTTFHYSYCKVRSRPTPQKGTTRIV